MMPGSHRPPDTTRWSCLGRVGVIWTIAVNVFARHTFCRSATVFGVVGNPVHTVEADATRTRQFCRVWRGGANWHRDSDSEDRAFPALN